METQKHASKLVDDAGGRMFEVPFLPLEVEEAPSFWTVVHSESTLGPHVSAMTTLAT